MEFSQVEFDGALDGSFLVEIPRAGVASEV